VAGMPACTVDMTSSGLGVTSTGSAGSSSVTTSGAAGSTGSSGAGGSATGGAGGSGAGGGDVDSGVADVANDVASGACFADDAADASVPPCTWLTYHDQVCTDDAGTQGAPLGAAICDDLEGDLKLAAFQELIDCLKVVPGADGGSDACSSAHDAAASDCSKMIFNRSMCAVPDSNVDGGSYGCAQIAASCPSDAGADGITVEQCQAWLGPFNDAARRGIIDCYLDPATPAGSSCADKFENGCVFPPAP
jgi:hypothetical protein